MLAELCRIKQAVSNRGRMKEGSLRLLSAQIGLFSMGTALSSSARNNLDFIEAALFKFFLRITKLFFSARKLKKMTVRA